MIYIIKDWREHLHKIEYSSRESLLKDITNIAKQLQQKYRDKSVLDEELKGILKRLERLDEDSPVLDELIDKAESIQAARDVLLASTNDVCYILGDNLEDKLNVKEFLGVGYRIHIPEIYEENFEEYRALLYSMIPLK